MQQRREQMIKQSLDRNAFIQSMVGEVAEKVQFKPEMFEKHIEDYKTDLKLRLKKLREGGNKD